MQRQVSPFKHNKQVQSTTNNSQCSNTPYLTNVPHTLLLKNKRPAFLVPHTHPHARPSPNARTQTFWSSHKDITLGALQSRMRVMCI